MDGRRTRPTPAEVAAARAARQARSEQDVNPWRVLGFVAFAVGGAWLWLGGVWAVVAAMFVVPPWCVITIQWRVVGRRRITADQRAAIRRVRVWQDPVWRW